MDTDPVERLIQDKAKDEEAHPHAAAPDIDPESGNSIRDTITSESDDDSTPGESASFQSFLSGLGGFAIIAVLLASAALIYALAKGFLG